jgi:hypothetical protein
MKHFLVLFMGVFLIITVGVIAQTMNETTTPESQSTLPDTESTKVPWEYPIAPGVWYPGEPLPEKPFRYYRIRCWPGCHHNSQYGKYPDRPESEKKSSM